MRERLVLEIQERARRDSSREFLLSFFSLNPQYSRLGLDVDAASLPAVRWKLRNLEILREREPIKFEEQLTELEGVLRTN